MEHCFHMGRVRFWWSVDKKCDGCHGTWYILMEWNIKTAVGSCLDFTNDWMIVHPVVNFFVNCGNLILWRLCAGRLVDIVVVITLWCYRYSAIIATEGKEQEMEFTRTCVWEIAIEVIDLDHILWRSGMVHLREICHCSETVLCKYPPV